MGKYIGKIFVICVIIAGNKVMYPIEINKKKTAEFNEFLAYKDVKEISDAEELLEILKSD